MAHHFYLMHIWKKSARFLSKWHVDLQKYLLLLIILFNFTCGSHPTEKMDYEDLWSYSSPEIQDMNAKVLDSALVQARTLGFVDGMLVIRNGYIVAEAYFNGYDKNHAHNIMSVTKSFLSAITGIAVNQDYIVSIEKKVLDYFPEYVHPGMDVRKPDITIRHLLTMRMGIAGEAENDYGVFQHIYNSDNWLRTTIEYPLLDDPGTKMRYNSFQTHLLAAILTKATNMSLLNFANRYLFDPLNIEIDYWEQDPQGYYFGGSNMFMRPREMALLGYLYLNKGRIGDEQIIPEDWIDLTLTASTDFKHPNQWGDFENYNYGYLWWLGQIGGQNMFMGYGYGGQFVVVFPGLNLIIVSTAKNQVTSEVSNNQEWAIFNLISTYILPAVSN